MWSWLGQGYINNIDATVVDQVIHPATGVPCELWEVVFSWSDDRSPRDDQPPTALQPKERWYGENYTVASKLDINGTPIETTAGEPIYAEFTYSYIILEVKRYERFPFDAGTMIKYVNKTNSKTFRGFPAKTGLMLPMTVEETEYQGIKLNEVTYTIKFKYDDGGPESGWTFTTPNQGYKFRPAPGADPEIFMKDEQPTIINLALDGTRLSKAEEDAGNFKYVSFEMYASVDFTPLGIDWNNG
jgi:hypothetical protein